MDGHRHSVDVPISRALIALRRVRSLRDPSTNSMSKLTALIDNLNWETNSHNGITLGFENGSCRGNNDNSVPELYYGSRHCSPKQVSPLAVRGAVGDVGSTPHWPLDDEGVHGASEGGGSCNELVEVLSRRYGSTEHEMWRENHDEFSGVTAGDVLSHAGSPYLSSVDKAPDQRPSQEMLFYRNSDVAMMEFCHQGCGISSCWSRATKFRETNLLPNEEQPLMLGNADQINATRNSMDWKVDGEGGDDPLMESPRSFCQRFMPKSFTELVGQKTIAASLVNAINSRQIASLYLFHGPRGTGKTSASRIFAAALNCPSRENGNRPCGLCQECVLFFSGRSRDVKEVDSVRINRKERHRLLIKNARIPPMFSRYKVYIINECHLMLRETWVAILNSLEELPERVVFVMTTPNVDKLPSSVASKSLRFHFQKVKVVDIADVLEKICVQEGLDYDRDALNFIATKSNGSLRDAEMMLDQLSLLGKKITVSLVYEVNGFVSNDELLDLLHLALSSDASNTVKKARELLGSRIDPLQLTSQLANLIMDILAGKCPDGVSEVRRKLFGTNNSEADLQQLSSALKILLQTEKQLRVSKNQTTWLTAALLQLSSTGSSYDGNDVRLSVRTLDPQDGDFLSTSSTGGESLKHHEDVEVGKMRMQNEKEELQLVWTRAAGICTSSSFRKFLQKHGKLLSIRLNQGIAVAELAFDHPEYVSKAEKSWKTIAGALQHVLGYNVELRINLASDKRKELKKPPYLIRFFNCSRKVNLSAECGSNESDGTPTTRDKYVETCLSKCPSSSRISHTCCHGKDLFRTIRSTDGNALSVGTSTPSSLPDSIDREDQTGSYPYNKRINTGHLSSNSFKPGNNAASSKEASKFWCWRNTMFPFRKAWQLRNQQRNEQLMDYALHCASAN